MDEQTQRCLNMWAASMRVKLVDAARELRNDPRRFGPALVWLHSDSRQPGSFIWCCELFGMDSERVVSKLYARRRDIAKLQVPTV